MLRIRRTWQRNATDSQSNASSNDDVIGMLITSRQFTNRRRTVENELGMNESQFVSVDSGQNTSEDVESIPRDDPPPPYSEIAQEATAQNLWNRTIASQAALGHTIIPQSALGGPVIHQGAIGGAIIQQGALGGAIIQPTSIGGQLVQQSELCSSMIQQGALAGAIIQHRTIGGTIVQQSALGGTGETSFNTIDTDRIGPTNVIRGYIINSAPGLNIVCDSNFPPPERPTQGPVILNLEVVENEVPGNDLPSYDDYLKSQNGCDP